MFTGREYDVETGLYYYRARYYSPTTGRFLQRDPAGYSAGINLYSYCSNNAINFVDPLGLDKQKNKSWWEELREGYYYGTGFGQDAVEWYAEQQLKTGSPLWIIPGFFAALWTPETYQSTGWALVAAMQLNEMINYITLYRYTGLKSNSDGKWLTPGKSGRAPYGKDFIKAKDALQMPYKPTGVKRIRIPNSEKIAGPRIANKNPQWGDGGCTEYYRGPNFPD